MAINNNMIQTQRLPQAGWFRGQDPMAISMQRFDPSQRQLMGQIGQQGLGALQQLRSQGQQPMDMLPQQLQQYGVQPQQVGQQGSFAPIAQREMRRFQQETVPGLAERFGGLNALGSSAFKQSLGQAGTDLSERLAAQAAQFGQQERSMNQQLLGQLGQLGMQQRGQDVGLVPQLFQTGLQQMYTQPEYTPRQASTFERAGGAAAKAIPMAVAAYMTGGLSGLGALGAAGAAGAAGAGS